MEKALDRKNNINTRAYQRKRDLVSRVIGDELLIVPLRGDIVDLQCLFTLNETGGFIWEQLTEPRTVEELAAALVEAFDVELPQATQDAQALVARLVEEGCASENAESSTP